MIDINCFSLWDIYSVVTSIVDHAKKCSCLSCLHHLDRVMARFTAMLRRIFLICRYFLHLYHNQCFYIIRWSFRYWKHFGGNVNVPGSGSYFWSICFRSRKFLFWIIKFQHYLTCGSSILVLINLTPYEVWLQFVL